MGKKKGGDKSPADLHQSGLRRIAALSVVVPGVVVVIAIPQQTSWQLSGLEMNIRDLFRTSSCVGEGPGRLEGDVESLSGKKGGWGGSPLHMAAATGRADVVQQLLLAGVSPLAWSPISTQYAPFQPVISILAEKHCIFQYP